MNSDESNRIWKLVARKLTGEATEEEVKELEDLLRADPEMHFTIGILYEWWNAVPVKKTREK